MQIVEAIGTDGEDRLAALAGFCSLGFGLGTYDFLSAFAP